MPVNKVLVCTVGGSHEPIVTALRNGRPDHAIFVCSGKDPATGRPGADEQIARVGNTRRNGANVKPSFFYGGACVG